jgi:hypothetical protein
VRGRPSRGRPRRRDPAPSAPSAPSASGPAVPLADRRISRTDGRPGSQPARDARPGPWRPGVRRGTPGRSAPRCKGVDTPGHLVARTVTPSGEQERAQVGALAGVVQAVTGGQVARTFADQGYPGEDPARAAAEHGIDLEVVRLPEAKCGFVLPPRRWVVVLHSFARLAPRPPLRAPAKHARWCAFHRLRLPHARRGGRRATPSSSPAGHDGHDGHVTTAVAIRRSHRAMLTSPVPTSGPATPNGAAGPSTLLLVVTAVGARRNPRTPAAATRVTTDAPPSGTRSGAAGPRPCAASAPRGTTGSAPRPTARLDRSLPVTFAPSRTTGGTAPPSCNPVGRPGAVRRTRPARNARGVQVLRA